MNRHILPLIAAACAAGGVATADVLMIPDSTADTVGMYDPFDGTYLGDLITQAPPGGFTTPINAILGPDDLIYLSDQVEDSVFRYDRQGNFIDVFADDTDGLNNIRGIDFRDGLLYVTSGDDYVAVFDGPHNRLPDFINDGTDPFDIHFLDDGRALLSDIQGSTDNVRLYNADGTLAQQLFSVSFPQQLQDDPLLPGGFLNQAFTADVATDFELDGTVVQTTVFNNGRGIWRLGNGNLLLTGGDGVWMVEPGTGALLAQRNTGSARFIELLPEASPIPGDVNGDGLVNVEDLLLLLSAWGPCPGCPEDINGDDVVDVQDLLLLLANWTI